MYKSILSVATAFLALFGSTTFAINCPSVNEVKAYNYISQGANPDTPGYWGFAAKNSAQQMAAIVVKASTINEATTQKTTALAKLHTPTQTNINGIATCVYEGNIDPRGPQYSTLPVVAVEAASHTKIRL